MFSCAIFLPYEKCFCRKFDYLLQTISFKFFFVPLNRDTFFIVQCGTFFCIFSILLQKKCSEVQRSNNNRVRKKIVLLHSAVIHSYIPHYVWKHIENTEYRLIMQHKITLISYMIHRKEFVILFPFEKCCLMATLLFCCCNFHTATECCSDKTNCTYSILKHMYIHFNGFKWN